MNCRIWALRACETLVLVLFTVIVLWQSVTLHIDTVVCFSIVAELVKAVILVLYWERFAIGLAVLGNSTPF